MDKIQKTLIEAGRKDLAQKYYKKITRKAKLINDKTWIDDKDKKQKLMKEEMEERGIQDVSKQLLDPLGNVLDWFIDKDQNLKEFWEMNHAYWGHDVSVGRKGKDYFLVDWQGNVLQLEVKTRRLMPSEKHLK